MCVRVDCASVVNVVEAAGTVEVVYRVAEAEGSAEAVVLCVSLSVCGLVLSGSPWTVTPVPLHDSAILASVAPERLAAFLRELSVWLPRRTYSLLYRSSRDGMTAQAFHSLCDDKGPTLVLVGSDKGFVCGGYAGASWGAGSACDGSVASPDAFVLSVVGPHSPGPVRFPVVARNADSAIFSDPLCGPVFRGGLLVKAFVGEWACSCAITGLTYEDVLGQGSNSFTGSHSFSPVEIEVFAVAHAV
ncbi:MAG: TLD domain-containing protein [Terracidiphilus sp.]|nr:TLD domain-containing protein [Terracidiphilus sp.]